MGTNWDEVDFKDYLKEDECDLYVLCYWRYDDEYDMSHYTPLLFTDYSPQIIWWYQDQKEKWIKNMIKKDYVFCHSGGPKNFYCREHINDVGARYDSDFLHKSIFVRKIEIDKYYDNWNDDDAVKETLEEFIKRTAGQYADEIYNITNEEYSYYVREREKYLKPITEKKKKEEKLNNMSLKEIIEREGDYYIWIHPASGYKCEITRPHGTYLCGYVWIPKTHSCYGMEADELDINVHGGLTLGSSYSKGRYGFDCAHAGDKYIFDNDTIPSDGVYRDKEYVRQQVNNLAQQFLMMDIENN